MKRTGEHTGSEPNSKRTKTQGFFRAIYTMGQNINAFVQSRFWGEQAQVLPSENIPEEGIPLIADELVFADVQPNIKELPQIIDEEIDADLEKAIAFSLMTDIEEEKAEEKPADKPVVPFGCQEKAQKIIAELSSYLEKKLINFYEKRSKSDSERFSKIELRNQYIKICIKKLEELSNEEAFLDTVMDIGWTAIDIAHIYGFDNAKFMTHPDGIMGEYAMLEKLLKEANFVEPFKKKMLAKYDETFKKYQTAFQFLEKLKRHNEAAFDKDFWTASERPFYRIKRTISILEDQFDKQRLAKLEQDLFQNFYTPYLKCVEYPKMVERFKGSMMMVESFFDANFVCNKMNLPSEVTAHIVLQALNPQSEILQFSQAHVTRMQKSMWSVQEARRENNRSKKALTI